MAAIGGSGGSSNPKPQKKHKKPSFTGSVTRGITHAARHAPPPPPTTRQQTGRRVVRAVTQTAGKGKKIKHTAKQEARVARQHARYVRHIGGQEATLSRPTGGTLISQMIGTSKTGADIEKQQLEALAPKGIQIVRALTGDEPGATSPTLGELANVGLTLATAGAGRALRAPKTAEEVAKIASGEGKVAAAAKGVEQETSRVARVAKKARAAPKAASERAATRVRRVKSLKTPEGRGASLKRLEAAAGKKAEHTARLATHPIAALPGPRERGQAFVEGTGEALNPVHGHLTKTLATTGRVIPASLVFPATVAADVGRTGVRAARTELAAAGLPGGHHYSGSQITAPLKGAVQEAVASGKALAPLFSGDPEKVQKTVENKVGLSALPLLPRGLISRPVKALRAKAGEVIERIPKRAPRETPPTHPGKLRRTGQVIAGRSARKRVSQEAARHVAAERFQAGREAHRIEKPLRKVQKSRSFKHLHGVEAGDAVSVLARYGISRKDALPQLRKVRDSLHEADQPTELTSTRKVIDFLEHNPAVLDDPGLWKSVDAYKEAAGRRETSQRAKYLAQARVASHEGTPILKPEERAPARARELTGKQSRADAWAEHKRVDKAAKAARRAGRKAATRAQEARGARRDELRDISAAHYREAKMHAEQAAEIQKSLRNYARPGQSLEGRRKPWNAEMVKAFVEETQGRTKGMEEPAYVAERRLPTEGDIQPKYNASASRMMHVKTGKAEQYDLADRSLRSLVSGSVFAPRIQQGLHRFVRVFAEQEARPKLIGGKSRTVFTSKEVGQLYEQRKFDPRSEVLIPSRQFKQALKSENFDLAAFQSEVTKRIRGEMTTLEDAPGSKYIIVKREAAHEFADQINPEGGRLEKGLSATSTVGSRLILGLSPAWMLSQVVAEGLQAVMAVSNPARLAKVVSNLRRLKREDPQGYEAFAGIAGESVASFETPHNLRVEMDGGTQARYGDAVRALKRTPVGRAIYETGTIRTLGLFDRWKSGKYRSILQGARVDKELNGFTAGLQGALRSEAKIAEMLKDKPLSEQMAWFARNPKELQRHTQYVDDVMGNWQAFTRFERAFAPALIFYPFLRMSMRWTFWSYPVRHPIKAQMLYLTSQQNAEELTKLLGHEPTFLELTMPIVHGDKGKPDLVLPGGSRFAAPGSNALVQAIGEDNVAGLARTLNPFLSIAFYGVSGVNPQTGQQDAQTPLEHGLLALNQFLSLAAPLRVARLNRVGQADNPITEAFRKIDPNAGFRSLVDPFEPLTASRAKLKSNLSRTLDQSQAIQSEVGQFAKLVDQYGLKKASAMLRQDIAASDTLKGLSGGQKDKRFQAIVKRYYEIKYPPQKSSGGGGSGWGGVDTGSSGGWGSPKASSGTGGW